MANKESNSIEQKLMSVTAERNLLLKELNHRVRNMIQTILSLTDIQSDAIQDPLLKKIFDENSQRIRVIGIVMDKANRVESIGYVNLKECITEIAYCLRGEIFPGRNDVELRLSGSDVTLNTDVAVSFGIIINEILQVALVAAVRESSYVSIRVEKDVTGIGVTVKSPLCGLDFWKEANEHSISCTLVKHLLGQIGASLCVDDTSGDLSITLPDGSRSFACP